MDSSPASLKKLKREAARKRKAQARSLKLHSEEQERLQRLEIDALVEQQRIERLERQGSKEKSQSQLGKSVPSVGSDHGFKQGESSTSSTKDKDLRSASKGSKASDQAQEGKNQQVKQEEQQQKKQLQLQQMRAVVETRRRLARGPRTMLSSSLSTSLPAEPSSLSSQDSTSVPLEDHRVVSTEYQAAGTQALMRVTLLAAGFVIGARGISARLIGQITGAIIQSWTESSASRSSTGVPIRLFRIQGRKAVVQAAVSLVEQAVAKYKELCECKRRGEFVQREHIINGVEFYYQPPPRKALAASCADQSHLPVPSSTTTMASVPAAAAGTEVPLASSLAFPPHQVWLQHLHQTQKQKQQAEMQKQEPSSQQDDDAERRNLCSLVAKPVRALERRLADGQVKQVLVSPGSPWKRSSGPVNSLDCPAAGSSLFSVFGGLPSPVAQDCESSMAPQFLKSSVSSTPFDFPNFDLFEKILPSTSIGLSKDQLRPRQRSEEFCMLCVERRSSARLMTCGHASFCSSCVQGLGKCPVCLETIVGWQPLKNGAD